MGGVLQGVLHFEVSLDVPLRLVAWHAPRYDAAWGRHTSGRVSRVGTVVHLLAGYGFWCGGVCSHDERARGPSRQLALRSQVSWSTSLRVLALFLSSRFQLVAAPLVR